MFKCIYACLKQKRGKISFKQLPPKSSGIRKENEKGPFGSLIIQQLSDFKIPSSQNPDVPLFGKLRRHAAGRHGELCVRTASFMWAKLCLRICMESPSCRHLRLRALSAPIFLPLAPRGWFSDAHSVAQIKTTCTALWRERVTPKYFLH